MRDYKSRSSKKKRPSKGAGLIVTTIVLVTAFAYGLMKLRQLDAPKPAAKVVKKAQVKPKKQYDFYKLLPKMEVDVSSQTDEKKSHADSLQLRYNLQVASFKNPKDADELKARLVLLGFDVELQTLMQNEQEWTRIMMGPYTSKRAAEADQHRLRKEKITSLLRTSKE